MKFVIALAFVVILGALASAGWFMLKRPGPAASAEGDKRMARALALRVALSIGVFVLLLVSYLLGWIQPTGMPLAR